MNPPQPTPTELALIAAPLLAEGIVHSSDYDVAAAVFDAHCLWQEAHRFCEAQAGRSAAGAGKEEAP